MSPSPVWPPPRPRWQRPPSAIDRELATLSSDDAARPIVVRRGRWDGDERGLGVGSAAAFGPALDALRKLIDEPGWVAEDPDAHLRPNLEAAVSAPASGLEIIATGTEPDGAFVVDLAWTRPVEPSRRELRAALIALVGSVAESMTTINERVSETGVELDVVTGSVPADATFASHGHTLRLRVAAPGPDRLPE